MQTNEKEYMVTIIINAQECYEIDPNSFLSIKNQSIGMENIQILMIDNGTGNSQIMSFVKTVFEGNVTIYDGDFKTLSDIKELIKGRFFVYGWNNAKYTLNTFEAFMKNNRLKEDNIDVLCMHEKGTGNSVCVNTNSFSRVIDLEKKLLCHLDTGSVVYKYSLLEYEPFINCPYSAYFSTILFYVACIKNMNVFVSGKECVYKGEWAENKYKTVMRNNNIVDYEYDIYDKCHMYLINCCISRFSYVPDFVQIYLCMDLALRLKGARLGNYSMTEQSKLEHIKEKIHQILMKISDKYILGSKLTFSEDKAYMFELKYGKDVLELVMTDGNIIPSYYNIPLQSFRDMSFSLDFLKIENNELVIEGLFKYFINIDSTPQISGKLSYTDEYGQEANYKIPADVKLRDVASNYTIGNTKIQQAEWFKLIIPLNENIKCCKLSFVLNIDGKEIDKNISTLGKYFPINAKLNQSYYYSEKYLVKYLNNKLIICNVTEEERKKAEDTYCQQIRTLKMGKQAVELRKAYFEISKKKQKQIWLFADRATMCDNGGKIFFDYVRENHPEIDAYFILNKDAGEFNSLKQELGEQLIENSSMEHKLLYMLCDYYISSQFNTATRYPFGDDKKFFSDFVAKEKFVYLQHGVIKDDMSWINQKRNQNFYGHVVSARDEYDSLYNEIDFNENNLWLTGLARFDKLYHNEKKVICIAPTWRAWLMPNLNPDGTRVINEKEFFDSKCYKFYQNLLTNKRLIDTADEYGYEFWYSDHPFMKPHTERLYHFDERIKIVDMPSDYVNACSMLMITDYSSAVFDFAYLRKPIIYTQMDRELFFDKHSFVGKGYFDYERDGFGEVIYDVDVAAETIINYIKNDCTIKEKYKIRIDKFFEYNDQNNCRRIFEEIVKRDSSGYFERNHYAECMVSSVDFQYLLMKIVLSLSSKEGIQVRKINDKPEYAQVKTAINNIEYVPEQFYQGKLGLKAVFWCLKGWLHYKFCHRK